jgi:methionyl-tRNA formyltransferase
MFDTILLLMDYGVEQPFLAAWLLENDPCLTIISVFTSAQLCSLEPDIFQRARLIAFAASAIVPGPILAKLRYGAYNFHPGPPEYPGWRPGLFALEDGSTEFGVTVHAMAEEVDAGPIVQVDRFEITPGDSIAALEAILCAPCEDVPRLVEGAGYTGGATSNSPHLLGPSKEERRSQPRCGI